MLESAKWQELAVQIGAEEALLARLEFAQVGGLGVECTLVPDAVPRDFQTTFFLGFANSDGRTDAGWEAADREQPDTDPISARRAA